MLKCIVTFSCNKYLKLSWLVRTGATEVNDTNSRAKFIYFYLFKFIYFHVAFSIVFIEIFRLFRIKSEYSLTD